MKKRILLLLITALVLTACGQKEVPAGESAAQSEEAEETEESEAETEEAEKEPVEPTAEETPDAQSEEPSQDAAASKVIAPLPCTIDMNALDNCTLAVSLNKEDIYAGEDGKARMKVTVYDYDLYDIVDISMMEVGSTMILRGEEVEITDLETNEFGLIFVNGGLDQGGFDLFTNENGVYFESGYSDKKSYYELGSAELPVAEDFVYIDASDLDNGEKEYTLEEVLSEDSGIEYHLVPDNTTIVIENGEVIEMKRVYIP